MKGDAIMTERFENRFNMSNSNAACTEFRSASSSCTKTTKSENTALLLTMDTDNAVSIFVAAVRVITVSICIIIGILSGADSRRPVLAAVR